MITTDSDFIGRTGWGEQVVYTAFLLEESQRTWQPPPEVYKNPELATWATGGGVLDIKIDLAIQRRLLVGVDQQSHRTYSYNPLHVQDIAVDRDTTTAYRGQPIQLDLMTDKNLITLEERTAYLLYAWEVQAAFIEEWNLFAALQENLWLYIYKDEGSINSQYDFRGYGAEFAFTEIASLPGAFANIVYPGKPAWIRNVDRANYDLAITQWLLDSGTTARSGGVAIDNDSYVNWLTARLSEISCDRALIADISKIDPRFVYRYFDPPPINISSDGSEGATGVNDTGNPDPANDDTRRSNLLEELLNNESPLGAALGSGAPNTPIDTLPDC